jgi:hypothetical protein
MSAPRWAAGMQKIGPGLYVDAREALHVDAAEICEAHGIPPTPANIWAVLGAFAETGAGTLTVTLAEDPQR